MKSRWIALLWILTIYWIYYREFLKDPWIRAALHFLR